MNISPIPHMMDGPDGFIHAYDALFDSNKNGEFQTDSFGPLAKILKYHMLTPAKGGSFHKFADLSDMTYFNHVLNGCTIGGRILRNELLSDLDEKMHNDLITRVSRLFFASVILHDANKLFSKDAKDSWRLDRFLEEHWYEIFPIVADYLSPVGSAEEVTNDLKFLILSAEERTRDQANVLKTNTDRVVLQKISGCVKLADTLAGLTAFDIDELYEQMRLFVPNLRAIKFNDVPQTMSRLEVGRAIVISLVGSNRLIAKLPDGVIFVDDGSTGLESDVIKRLDERNAERESSDRSWLQYRPSNLSIPFNFASTMVVTRDVINRFIEVHNQRFLLWQGEEWRKAHPDLPEVLRPHEIILTRMDSDPPKFRIWWGESSTEAGDRDIEARRLVSKLIFARRIQIVLKKDRLSFKDEDERLEQMGLLKPTPASLQHDTLRALIYPILNENSRYQALFDDIVEDIVAELEKNYPIKTGVTSRELYDHIVTDDPFAISELPAKGDMCLQCGGRGDEALTAPLSFGIKPTCGGGRKITSLRYSEKVNGRICRFCRYENQLRNTTFGPIKEGLCIQIHLGDYMAPVNVRSILNNLKIIGQEEGTPLDIDVENSRIKLTPSEAYQLDYHALTFIDRPGNKTDEYYLIRRMIQLIGGTGFKVRITPLFSSDRVSKPMLYWENAPAWVKRLHWNEVRIDQLNDVNRELKLIQSVASLGRGPKDITPVLLARTRHPRGLFYIADRFMINGGLSLGKERSAELNWYLEKYAKELDKMSMDTIVEAACDIVREAPRSNNDHDWMIRTALETFERNKKMPREDRIQMAAGRLWDFAKRANQSSGESVQTACLRFATELDALLAAQYPQGFISSDSRRDLVAQFKIMYNMAKWGQIMKRGQ